MIVPYTSLPSWRFSFPLSVLVAVLCVWTGITIAAGLVLGRQFDYYVTKADNRVLKTKMAYVADEIEESRKYLAMAKKTEDQMRQALGMSQVNNPFDRDAEAGGATADDSLSFRQIMAKKASEISDKMFRENIAKVDAGSRRTLASFQEMAWYLANKRTTQQATPSIKPVNGRITSNFGYRFSPFGDGGFGEFHPGLDLSAKADTPIYATADGVVRHAGWAQGYGQAILIDHGFGFSTLYGHAAELRVKEGDTVTRGQRIASVGTTGRSTGPHLHYEVWLNGKPVNPVPYLKVSAGDAADRS